MSPIGENLGEYLGAYSGVSRSAKHGRSTSARRSSSNRATLNCSSSAYGSTPGGIVKRRVGWFGGCTHLARFGGAKEWRRIDHLDGDL